MDAGNRRPPLLAAYLALSGSRFSRAMNWVIAAAGVAYAAWLVAGEWPAPGPLAIAACACAALGVALAFVDVPDLARRAFGRYMLRRMVRRPHR